MPARPSIQKTIIKDRQPASSLPPTSDDLELVVRQTLTELGIQTWGEGHYRQYRYRGEWRLRGSKNTPPDRVYAVRLLYASDETPVVFEVKVDGRPVARVGLTNRELKDALARAYASR